MLLAKNNIAKSEIIFYNGEKFEMSWIPFSEINEEIKSLPTKQCSGYYFNKKGEVLLVKKKKTGHWSLPGGHPEIGETPIETAQRELEEESSQNCDHLEELGSVMVKDKNNNRYLQKRFFGIIENIREFQNDYETSEIKFIPVKEINNFVRYADSLIFRAGLIEAIAKFKEYEKSKI